MSLFKKSIANDQVLDLTKHTPETFENLKCIKNVVLSILLSSLS